MEFQDALAVLRAFEVEGVQYVLVGSMAMAAQGVVRATQDMDVVSRRRFAITDD